MSSTTLRWKGRGSLPELVDELQRRVDARVDFICDDRDVEYVVDDGSLKLAASTKQAGEWVTEPAPFNDAAITQLAGKMSPNVPTRYFRDALDAHPEEWATFLNDTVRKAPKRRFWRLLDGRVRAVLSDTYGVIEDYDVVLNILDASREYEKVGPIEATLSDYKMSIKMANLDLFDAIEDTPNPGGHTFIGSLANHDYLSRYGINIRELPDGPDTVFPLATFGNSETGHGSYFTWFGLLKGLCLNGLMFTEVFRKVHIGKKMETGIWSRETMQAEAETIRLKIRDSVRTAFEEDTFREVVKQAKGASEVRLAAPAAAVDQLISATDLRQDDRDAILQYWLRDSGPTVYGLAQAVSRYSQDVEDPDLALTMEHVGGQIVMNKSLSQQLVAARPETSK